MNTTRLMLQVPITQALKEDALVAAQEMGFSSLQEAVRFFLIKIVKHELVISIRDITLDNATSQAVLDKKNNVK